MQAYSLDLRERVVRAVDRSDSTQKQIAERFGVSTAWIKKLLKQRRETDSIAALPHGGGRKSKYEGKKLERLGQELRDQPDATLEELRNRTRKDASLMAVFRALKRLGSRRKKSRFVPPSKTGPMSPRSGESGLK
jgi:transposase